MAQEADLFIQPLTPSHRRKWCVALSQVTLALVILGRVLPLAADPVNVRDFGAVGDGEHDDTAAIRRAFKAVGGISAKYPGTAYYHEMRPVVFPYGRYRISDSIEINNTTIRGEGAVIEQTDPQKPIFEFAAAWRLRISGFTFLSGKHHLQLSNPNIDSGWIVVEDCRFYGSRSASIHLYVQSTNLTIRDCTWLQCMQVLDNRCDQAVIRDSWITTHSDMRDMAAIEHRAGRLTIQNLCGVPLVNGQDQRWIDNHSTEWLSLIQCRFGGEGGGFTPVVNFAKARNQTLGSMIYIRDSLLCAVGNRQRQCVVYCEEIPNSIVVRDCNTYVPIVRVRESIDPATYFAGVPRQMIRFDVRGNCNAYSGPDPILPAWLEDPATPPGNAEPVLTEEQTDAALKQAAARAAALPSLGNSASESGAPLWQTDPTRFQSITGESHVWDLDTFMDATTEKNSSLLALAPVGDSVVFVRRKAGVGKWPHVQVRDVWVDLERFPILSLKFRDLGNNVVASAAVKVLDHETQRMLVLGEWTNAFYVYRAWDLRKTLGATAGKRRVDVLVYLLGVAHHDLGAEGLKPQQGDQILLQFLRMEAADE